VNKKWLAIALFVAAGAAGCKQGIGQRCQVNDDCSSGVCSMASPKVCVSEDSNETPIDGMLPVDMATDTATVNGQK
jgi:hypothetical protein